MGNEPSKQPAVEPPPEWDPHSNAEKFELVSPMSDLSDPSMFLHRRPHPKLSDATVQDIVGKKQARAGQEPPAKLPVGAEHRKGPPAAARQTPAGDRRRRSKVITRDSTYKHESRPRELPPPSSFYFPNVPTRESEETLNRLSVRKSFSTGARRESNDTKNNGAANHQQDQEENKENIVRKNTPLLKKAKRKVTKARHCLTGCFEESTHKIQLMKDNAKPEAIKGERLSSEAGVTADKESLLKVEENPTKEEEEAFDPYEENPLPKAKATVLQFVDGAEKELAFNPVWRESHDGTYHSDPSSTAEPRRASDFALTKRNSQDSSRRASDPPCRPHATKKDAHSEEASADNKAKNDQIAQQEDPSKEEKRQSVEPARPRKSVGTVNTNNQSATSVATSHESTYWNGFYKETQVLHHEDAYFDRIAFVPNTNQMPEPSPMANHSTATPVVALFGGQDKPKSLLGSMDTGDVDFQENRLRPSQSDSFFGAGSLAAKSKRLSNGTSDTGAAKDDEQRDDSSLSQASSKSEAGPRKSSSLKNATDGASKGVEDVKKVGDLPSIPAKKDDPEENQPFDEGFMRSCKSEDQAGDETETSDDGNARRDSFLDRRISADQILVQTSLIKNMAKVTEPKRQSIDIKQALQATPQASVVDRRTSIDSAFSYKDRDVFTPVTSLTTYPKGSPFRPRVAINEKAMAKANLDQPVVLTQSCDLRSRSSRDMEIHASESAPSMIESHDYRDIALGCFPEDTPTTMANKKERTLALFSPGVMSLESPMSTARSPAQPLLSNQVVSNAAFLFSPSYASGNSLSADGTSVGSSQTRSSQQSKQIVASKSQDSTISISTLGSRSRLSGRSMKKKPIRIPFSSTGSLPPIRSGPRKSSLSEASSRQKSVRFSDSKSVAEQSDSASQKSRRSVTWDFSFKAAPDNVDIPAIETKVSDLSDTVFGRDPSPVGSTSKQRDSVESTGSAKSSRRESTIEEETASLTLSDTLSRQSSANESRQSLASTRASQEPLPSTGTPEQTRTWTYNEFSRGVTPLLDKKQLTQATNSPVLRFKAAKSKFVGTHTQEKEVPVKKSPSIHKRKPGTGRVHLLASKFDNGHAVPEPMTLLTYAKDFSTASSAVDQPTTTAQSAAERPMLRTPQIIGYTAKAYPSIYQRASLGSHSTSSSFFNHQTSKPATTACQTMPTRTLSTDSEATYDVHTVDEEDSDDNESQRSNGSDDSTFVQSVATLVTPGRQTHGAAIKGVNIIEEDQDEDDPLDNMLNQILQAESTDSYDNPRASKSEDDVPADEAEDDFAELLLNNILSAPSLDESECGVKRSSLVSTESSTFTNIMSVSDESTTMSALLSHKQTPICDMEPKQSNPMYRSYTAVMSPFQLKHYTLVPI